MPSLIDKIIVYGVPNPERMRLTEVLANTIPVCSLEFYSSPESPNHDHLQKVDFEMWAYPDGIKVYDQHYAVLNDEQPEYSFFHREDLLKQRDKKTPPDSIYSFVLTDYDLNRTYCTAISWHQKHFIHDDRSEAEHQQGKPYQAKPHISMAVPKCRVETMVNNPLILDPTTALVYVPKVMIVCSRKPCVQLQRALLKYYFENALSEENGKGDRVMLVPRIMECEMGDLIKNLGYARAEALFDAAKSEPLKKLQMKLLKSSMRDGDKDKHLGAMKISSKNLKQLFLASLFLLPDQSKTPCILSINGTKVASTLPCSTVFSIPSALDMCSQQFQPLQGPLLPLPVPELIQLWKCLLLEKQVLMFSNSQYASIALCELLLHLIQPIKWENIYIPFLPFHLSHHVEAIGGYLIGMSRIHMDYMVERFDMKTKVLVDLEHQTILEEGGKEVVELPDEIALYIESELKNLVAAYEQSKKPNRSLINYLITTPHEQSMTKTRQKTKHNYAKFLLEVQRVFFHALVGLFNNFIPFVSKKEDGIISVQTENYLSMLEDAKHRTFMKEISKTMVFIRLCEYHMDESERCAWVQKTIGELFVYSHDILSHKFLLDDAEAPLDHETIPSKASHAKKAYAWRMADLLKKQQKYCKYIDYLFDKNSKQILDSLNLVEQYMGQEQNKYRILLSNDQFQSFEALGEIKVSADFGKREKNKPARHGMHEEDNIYEQIYSQEALQSKKWKKFGEKTEEELYEQYNKSCSQFKFEKFLVKYLKYIELNFPESIKKVKAKPNSSSKSKSGILGWLWGLVNPTDLSKAKQEDEIRHKLKRKNTVRTLNKQQIINLKCLFSSSEATKQCSIDQQNRNQNEPQNKPGKQGRQANPDMQASVTKKYSQFMGEFSNTKRPSRTHSLL